MEPFYEQNPELLNNLVEQIVSLAKENKVVQEMMDAVREIYPTLELDERGLPGSNKEEYFRELVQGFCELIAEGKFLRGQKRALGS